MSKTTNVNVIETVSDDATIRGLLQSRVEEARELEEAVAARGRLRVGGEGLPYGLDFLRADERAREAERRVAVIDREIAAADRAKRERIIASRQPGRAETLRRLLATAEAAHADALAQRAYDEETAAAAGVAVGPAPLAALLGPLPEQIEALRRKLDAPERANEVPAPVASGKRRVRMTARVHSADRLSFYLPGDRVDVDADAAKDLVKRQLAEFVA